MGRRKIEIQPITHERNRSVTFLKRKHGLFKKAYELGVLCRVDVAVIIFEEKVGHHVKLYQYCSSDIHDMVQRHMRHEGEKDTRSPADFSGAPSAKFGEDFGDDEDGDVDDDDESRRGVKRLNDGHVKPEDISLDVDLNYSHVAAPSLHGGMSANIPTPSDRRHSHHHSSSSAFPPNKRPRYTGALPSGSDRSPRDSFISPTGQTFSRTPHGPEQNAYPSYLTNTTAPEFPPETNFSASHLSRDSRNGNSGTPSYPPRSTAYDAALYTPLRPNIASGGSSAGGEAFKFLDGESRGRASTSAPGVQLGSSIDWPAHGNSGSYSPSTPMATNNQNTAPANENTWLDYLSAPHGGSHGGGNPVPNAHVITGRRNSESMSWERGPGSGSSMSSPFTRTMATIVNDETRRSKLGSSGSDEVPTSSGNVMPSGLSMSIKQEKDMGG